jgi:hypothetical protein
LGKLTFCSGEESVCHGWVFVFLGLLFGNPKQKKRNKRMIPFGRRLVPSLSRPLLSSLFSTTTTPTPTPTPTTTTKPAATPATAAEPTQSPEKTFSFYGQVPACRISSHPHPSRQFDPSTGKPLLPRNTNINARKKKVMNFKYLY